MTDRIHSDELAADFERDRPALTALARRLLGSRAEAEDAVQDAWIRYAAHSGQVDNPAGWLRTVVTRICLDRLRVRRRERPLTEPDNEVAAPRAQDPESVAELADDIGRVLLMVLQRLTPDERVAFVVHEMFAVPYAEIAPLLGRSPEATKKLAGRARAKVRGRPVVPANVLSAHRDVVGRFLDAARAGDVERILTVLAPDVVRTADASALSPGAPATLRGSASVAAGTALLAERSRKAEIALVDGDVGLVIVADGRVVIALRFNLVEDLIAGYDVVSDADRLAALSIGVLPTE